MNAIDRVPISFSNALGYGAAFRPSIFCGALDDADSQVEELIALTGDVARAAYEEAIKHGQGGS
jgi:hypothetical protein